MSSICLLNISDIFGVQLSQVSLLNCEKVLDSTSNSTVDAMQGHSFKSIWNRTHVYCVIVSSQKKEKCMWIPRSILYGWQGHSSSAVKFGDHLLLQLAIIRIELVIGDDAVQFIFSSWGYFFLARSAITHRISYHKQRYVKHMMMCSHNACDNLND